MSIGFTGTQTGLTAGQIQALDAVLKVFRREYTPANTNFLRPVFHHGDCIGADEAAAKIALETGYYVIAHPPINEVKRSKLGRFHMQNPPLEYLDRNLKIVEASEILLAGPSSEHEAMRSGTWSTVRRARERGLLILRFHPDGTVVDDASAA